MDSINQLETEKNYAQARIMIRCKNTGKAAQVLVNNTTKHNFDAIIDRLEDTYGDQRPLYVLDEDMIKNRQNNSPIHVYVPRGLN